MLRWLFWRNVFVWYQCNFSPVSLKIVWFCFLTIYYQCYWQTLVKELNPCDWYESCNTSHKGCSYESRLTASFMWYCYHHGGQYTSPQCSRTFFYPWRTQL
jgi:hypothetical protein